MSIWNNPEFQRKVKDILVWSSETTEANAACLKESATMYSDGNWGCRHDEMQYEFEMRMVQQMDALLHEIETDKS